MSEYWRLAYVWGANMTVLATVQFTKVFQQTQSVMGFLEQLMKLIVLGATFYLTFQQILKGRKNGP